MFYGGYFAVLPRNNHHKNNSPRFRGIIPRSHESSLRISARPMSFCPAAPPGTRSRPGSTSGITPEEEYVRERRRNYELMIVISPLHANEEGIAAAIERVTHSIVVGGGEVSGVNQASPWGRRKLAYPIREYASGEASRRNFTEGYYVLITFSLSAGKMLEVERTIKLTDAIMRHLMTVIEQKSVVGESAEGAEVVAEKAE
jgi:small subunit ribosomal protein S6